MYSIGKVVNYIIRAIICVTAFIFANTVYVKADIIEKAEIQLSMDCPIEITNKEGETLIIGDKRELSGTMNILKQEYTATMPADVVLTVRKSDIYYIKKATKGYSYVAICYANSDRSVLVTLNDEASVVIDMIKKRVEISGISQKFSCEICMNANDIWYTLDGFLSEKTVLEDKDDSLLTSGICGKTDVSICDMEKAIYSSKMILSKKIRWYCSNKRVLKINNKKGKMKALKKGKCYIWAKAHNGINSKKIKVIIK